MTAWIETLLGGALPAEDGTMNVRGRSLRMKDGILRDCSVAEAGQAQTRDTFAYKWARRDTYSSPAMRDASRIWLRDRYAGLVDALADHAGQPCLLLDAGCGAGYSAGLLFDGYWPKLRYVGADISTAVDIARDTISSASTASAFLQCDLTALPFADGMFDIVLSEGVLHHTPSTREALLQTARLVKPGGLYAIYVYAQKSPAREFTDDYIRGLVSDLPEAEAWETLMPLTRLGQALGELGIEIDVPEDVAVLGVPKGRIDIQRLFYWHVCKMYYRPDFTLDEMNHVNFDWFTPKYAHRQTPDEVKAWCAEAGLEIVSLNREEAGITVLARRPAG